MVRHWNWNQWTEFKFWMKLIEFHFPLKPLGKVWIYLFSLHLWLSSRADWVLEEKLWILISCTSLDNWPSVTACPRWRGQVNTYVVPLISFQTFFVQAFKIVIDSWIFSMLLQYILWDDWPIFIIQEEITSKGTRVSCVYYQ